MQAHRAAPTVGVRGRYFRHGLGRWRPCSLLRAGAGTLILRFGFANPLPAETDR
jgi:hypothetical protein